MQVSVVQADPAAHRTDALVVSLFHEVTPPTGVTGAVDKALGGLISKLISEGEVTGKSGELTLIHTPDTAYKAFGPKRVLVVGLGNRNSFDLDTVRNVSAEAVRRLGRSSVRRAATIVHGAGSTALDPALCAGAVAEGSLLGSYRFDKYRSNAEEELGPRFEHLEIIEPDGASVARSSTAVRAGETFASSALIARDLVNEPGNVMTPTAMAAFAQSVASEADLQCIVLERAQVEALGMGAYLGVAAGSAQLPKFIHLSYIGDRPTPQNNLWLIGKGITFDSGGISIKPAENMGDMKGDMGGGAAVIGAIKAIAAFKPRINVHAVVAAAENMPGGSAQRPGDIVRAMNGKHIEIENTDAEGRLTLADAICYAKSQGAARIIDVATLTGAVRVALGTGNAAAFSNNDSLIASFMAAAKKRGEPFWRLPLDATSKRQNASKIADMKNTGGRAAGAITAAHFIAEFAGDTPWVHLDIAALNLTDAPRGVNVTGATGIPARTLVQLALDIAR